MQNPNGCTKCGLCKFSHNPGIRAIGPSSARIMVIGDNPNIAEDKSGEFGAGGTHKLLLELCNKAGINFSEVYYTPAVKCRKNDKGKVPVGDLKICKESWLYDEIESIKPEYIITLGATALKAVTNKAKITEVHGKLLEHRSGAKVMPTFHTAMSLRDPRYYDRIFTDFVKFGKIINGEKRAEHKLVFKAAKKLMDLAKITRFIEQSEDIAFDLETNGLDMRLPTSEITTTIISNRDLVWVVEHRHFKFSTLQRFHRKWAKKLKGKRVAGQNAKFDNLWLHYIFGCRFPLTFDTMLASHLLDENSPNALKYQARAQLEMDDWDIDLETKKGAKEPDEPEPTRAEVYKAKRHIRKKTKGMVSKSRIVIKLKEKWVAYRESLERLAEYAAWDGYATIRLMDVFDEGLKQEPELDRLFHRMVMPVARAYEDIEINGTYIDQAQMDEAEIKLKRSLRRIRRALMNYIGPWRASDESEINWNSADDVNRVLFDWLKLTPAGYTDGGKPSTAEDYLIKMKDQHPIISHLLEYRGKFKQLSSFIEGWRKRMIDGYIYPNFKVAGTVTGRPSCSNPNLQQVPRDPFIRSLIGAPKGWVFFEVDYSQVELRVAAALSGEPNMLRIFRTGGDIHTATYVMLMGCTPEEMCEKLVESGEIIPEQVKAQLKEERKKAKAVNFGFIYGMGAKKFREYAEAKYGLILTEAESKQWRKRYFEQYPGLLKWHDRQRRIVHAAGSVRTLTGRMRHLPHINSPDRGLMAEAERNAINAPVQGFGAEMILMSLIEVNDYFRDSGLLRLCGTIHDAMVGLVREDVALECMARVKKIMEAPKLMEEFGIELPLPIIADVSLGNWGIAREYAANELPEPIELEAA